MIPSTLLSIWTAASIMFAVVLGLAMVLVAGAWAYDARTRQIPLRVALVEWIRYRGRELEPLAWTAVVLWLAGDLAFKTL